ncbi:MAG: hydratase [Burkholderiales bacterium]|nr:hydratase [Burkholderiales bacterium]
MSGDGSKTPGPTAERVTEVERLAASLLAAWDSARCVPLPSAAAGGIDTATAYAVSERLRQMRVARGERTVGWKIGFTNRGIWERYGVCEPMWAPVWDTTTELLAGAECRLSLAGLSQPRLEPEVVFGLAQTPRPGMTLDELRACVEWVAHGFEVVHTHFEGWRFTAPDTAADFALHGRLRVGPRVPLRDWPAGGAGLAADLAALQVELSCDGEVKDRGQGAIVLDGPLQALQAMVDAMARTTPHWSIRAGDCVTTGTITDAWPLVPGQRWSTRLSDSPLRGLTLHTQA